MTETCVTTKKIYKIKSFGLTNKEKPASITLAGNIIESIGFYFKPN